MSDDATVIAAFPKNSREEMRVSLDTFKKHRLVHMRAWATREGAEAVPTRAGFGLRVGLIPTLREALAEAEAEAKRRGWTA